MGRIPHGKRDNNSESGRLRPNTKGGNALIRLDPNLRAPNLAVYASIVSHWTDSLGDAYLQRASRSDGPMCVGAVAALQVRGGAAGARWCAVFCFCAVFFKPPPRPSPPIVASSRWRSCSRLTSAGG